MKPTLTLMSKQQIQATVYQYALIIILLAAIAISGGRDFLFQKEEVEVNVALEDMRGIYPTAAYYTENRLGAYDAYGSNRDKIGSALLSSN